MLPFTGNAIQTGTPCDAVSRRAFLRTGGTLIAGGLTLPRLAASEQIDPALTPDPEVTKILDGLGDNSLAVLPSTKVTGEFNDLARLFQLDKRGPGGRDFTIKMVWAPERRRALFCGANHGTPHRLNDCWEFDLAANTWQLLYAPDFNDGRNARQFNSKVILKDGVIQTEGGGPVHAAHTWWQFTYDPVRKRALWICCMPGLKRLHEGKRRTGSISWTTTPSAVSLGRRARKGEREPSESASTRQRTPRLTARPRASITGAVAWSSAKM